MRGSRGAVSWQGQEDTMCPCKIVESYLPYGVTGSQATQQCPPLQVQDSDLRTLRRGWKCLQLLYPAVQATSQSEALQLFKQESIPQPFGVYLERKMALQRLGERYDSLHPSVFRGSGLLTSPWNGPATSVPTTHSVF